MIPTRPPLLGHVSPFKSCSALLLQLLLCIITNNQCEELAIIRHIVGPSKQVGRLGLLAGGGRKGGRAQHTQRCEFSQQCTQEKSIQEWGPTVGTVHNKAALQ